MTEEKLNGFAAEFEKDAKEHNIGGGDWYKFQEGDNKMRILATPVLIQEKFKVGIVYPGCSYENDDNLTSKYLTYVYDYRTDKIMTFKLPYKITGQIVSLMTSEDYHFDSFPMPFDININAKGAGKTTVQYTLTPARNNTEVPEDVIAELENKTPIKQVVERMQDKKRKEDGWEEIADSQDDSVASEDIVE